MKHIIIAVQIQVNYTSGMTDHVLGLRRSGEAESFNNSTDHRVLQSDTLIAARSLN